MRNKFPSGVPYYGRPQYAQTWLDRVFLWFRTPSSSMIQYRRNAPYMMPQSRTYGR